MFIIEDKIPLKQSVKAIIQKQLIKLMSVVRMRFALNKVFDEVKKIIIQ